MNAIIVVSCLLLNTLLHGINGKDISPAEFYALYDLYNATHGTGWLWQNQSAYGMAWNFTDNSNVCLDKWQGLVCDWNDDEPYYHIRQLDLMALNLRGRLPDTLDKFPALISINFMYNGLTGPLPSSMGNIPLLYYLALESNFLSGPIPASFANLTQLAYILYGYNHFTGPFPDLSQQLLLSSLGIGANHFTGPLPNYLGDLHLLEQINVYFNEFTGTVPSSISRLPKLNYLGLQYNQFSGPLVVEEGDLVRLLYCGLYRNTFTGTLPAVLGNLPKLQYLEIQNNHFSGPIPSSLGDVDTLVWMDFDTNLFSGTVPESLGQLSAIKFISLSRNRLVGTIPTTLSGLSTLTELLMESNALSGNLHDVFDASVQHVLATVELNDNQLTGTLPASVFAINTLTTFAVVGNCFSGTLPATICTSNRLRSLVLDGLSSASNCHDKLLPGVSSSYIVQHKVNGQIPPCLFQLPNLTTLHLSGNGFTGTLPEHAPLLGKALIDLSLSHNRLTGTVPAHIQEKQWYSLDLSYNRLTGTLDAQWFPNVTFSKPEIYSKYITDLTLMRIKSFQAANITVPWLNLPNVALDVSVSLENNRLSGRIPGVLQRLRSVAILGSNLFSCSLDEHNLPTHDSGAQHYQCGSDSFNLPYYVWLVLSGILALLIIAAVYGGECLDRYLGLSARLEHVKSWYAASVTGHEDNAYAPTLTAKVFELLHFIVNVAVKCSIYVCVVLLPIYIATSAHCGTLTHQYAWTVSAAYLSGKLPLSLEFTFWLLVVFAVLFSFVRFVTQRSADGASHSRIHSVAPGTAPPTRVHKYARTAAIYAIYLTINLVVVVGVNVGYVYIAIYESSVFLTLAQILISFFKLLWNNLCAATILKWAAAQFSEKGASTERSSRSVETRFASLQIFVALFNNIVVPCATVAVVSPNCFYNVFVSAPDVSSYFAYSGCAMIDRLSGTCDVYVPRISHTSYSPPFTYNYQCSSSLITYYAPAYVNLCIVSAFLAPALQYTVFVLYLRADRGTRWFRWLDGLLTRIMKPVTLDTPTMYSSIAHEGPTAYDPVRPYFNGSRVMIILFNLLGLLLTFGVVFPPLAVSLVCAMATVTTLARLRVGRFLSGAAEVKQYDLVRTIETECTGVGSVTVLKNAMWMLIMISCWFYTLFLFDTLGDAVGFDGAYWVLIVMPLMPLLLYAAYQIYCTYFAAENHTDISDMAHNEGDVASAAVTNTLHGEKSTDSEVILELRSSTPL